MNKRNIGFVALFTVSLPYFLSGAPEKNETTSLYKGPPNMLGLAEGGMKASLSPYFVSKNMDAVGFMIEWGDGTNDFVAMDGLPCAHEYKKTGRKEITVKTKHMDGTFSEAQSGVVTANDDGEPLREYALAFPGAAGFGSETRGGNDGKLYEVTSLSGGSEAGTIRHALAAEGARKVIFKVSGVIELRGKSLEITHPYITIDGSTAPGQGVVLKDAPLVIMTHDVIVRHLKMRPGDDPNGVLGQYRNALQIIGHDDRKEENDLDKDPYNIIVDHCSLSWSTDQVASTWYGASHVTFSWNIFSEALSDSIHNEGPHSTSFMYGPNSMNMSFHHNIIAHGGSRNPLVYINCSAEVISNVIYNWEYVGTNLGGIRKSKGITRVNLIGNYYLPGPDTSLERAKKAFNVNSGWKNEKIYIHDNSGRIDGVLKSDLDLGRFEIDTDKLEKAPVMPLTNTVIDKSSEILKILTAKQGAGAQSKSADPVDKRIKGEILSGTGEIIDSQKQREGYEIYRR